VIKEKETMNSEKNAPVATEQGTKFVNQEKEQRTILRKLLFDHALSQLDDCSKIKKAKKSIARTKTAAAAAMQEIKD